MLVLALLACTGSDDTDTVVRPPQICNPATTLPNNPYFLEATDDVGLTGIHGSTLNAVDYDADGWTDLVVNTADSNSVNDFGAKQINHLLHNENGVFVDKTEASGFTSRRRYRSLTRPNTAGSRSSQRLGSRSPTSTTTVTRTSLPPSRRPEERHPRR